ncbi:MAG: hypothetical protein O7G87_11445 [bacterium]|nr:hypothetical protein [bacterium]
MLSKCCGLVLLIIGGFLAVCILMMVIGTLVGLLMFALKVAVPVLLVYAGYRLLTRDRRIVY